MPEAMKNNKDKSDQREPQCPFCQSFNVLPYEEDDDKKKNDSLTIIILSGLIIISSYLLLMVSLYISFPFVIFTLIIITTKLVNKKEKQVRILTNRDFLCLNCDNSFESHQID